MLRETENINTLIQEKYHTKSCARLCGMARFNHSCGWDRKAAGAEAEKVASAVQVHRSTCLGLRTEIRKIKSAEGERIEIIMKSEKSVLTIHQASMEYGFPECGLRTIIKEGRIPVFKIGNRVYITRKTMEEFLEQGGVPYGTESE